MNFTDQGKNRKKLTLLSHKHLGPIPMKREPSPYSQSTYSPDPYKIQSYPTREREPK